MLVSKFPFIDANTVGFFAEFRNLPNLPEQFGNDWLSNADEIVLPEALHFAPQTPGWWWLALLLGVVVLCVGYAQWQRYQKTRYVREALKQLEILRRRLGQGEAEALAGVPELMKRVALSHWPRTELVPLDGHEWMSFWQHTSTQNPPEILVSVAYLDSHALASIAPNERLSLLAWVEQWIRQHRRYRHCSVETLVQGV